jgi:hypothetical protein
MHVFFLRGDGVYPIDANEIHRSGKRNLSHAFTAALIRAATVAKASS